MVRNSVRIVNAQMQPQKRGLTNKVRGAALLRRPATEGSDLDRRVGRHFVHHGAPMRKLKSANTTQMIATTFNPMSASADPTAASAPRTAHATSASSVAMQEITVPVTKRYQSNSQLLAQDFGNTKMRNKATPPTTDRLALNRSKRRAG